MEERLKILHLEDFPEDAELVARHLRKAGFKFETLLTDSEADFTEALKHFTPDVILSDHSLASFDSHEALKIVKGMGLKVPFILVTATVSEEYAVSIIKDGASDYILKDRLQRLPNAITVARRKFNAEKELECQRIAQEKLITQTSIQVQEREREEIGRELHDNINQILAAAKLYLDLVISKDHTDVEMLESSRDNIVLAIEEIRKLSHTLVAPSLGNITLIAAIEDLVREIRQVTLLDLNFIVQHCDESKLNDNLKLSIYRIIQEQLNNILKHSGATAASVKMSLRYNRFVLTVIDNGKGFDMTQRGDGVGLRNIRQRTGFYDGTVHLHSAPGEGCTLEVNIPVPVNNEPDGPGTAGQ